MRPRRLYETRSRILRVLERLADELCATVYLFGSYARGDHTLESYVDMIVVSEKLRGVPTQERVMMVRLDCQTT
jgi:predicted nucleotidyltransferase